MEGGVGSVDQSLVHWGGCCREEIIMNTEYVDGSAGGITGSTWIPEMGVDMATVVRVDRVLVAMIAIILINDVRMFVVESGVVSVAVIDGRGPGSERLGVECAGVFGSTVGMRGPQVSVVAAT
jgi:hypothetical protein